jgi:tRNA G18 (ribose-2'-O)-methylase SpoU
MPDAFFDIRICQSCGLRYPITQDGQYGDRCPVCMGETRIILNRQLIRERKAVSNESTADEKVGILSVLLDNIRSAWNVGSILRSADGFGFAHAYLCGITPTPENEAVTKTSMGAEDSVSWSHHKDAVKLVKGLKKEGLKILALEDDQRALPLDDAQLQNQRSVLIVGNEIAGIDLELLDLCDSIYCIPMHGEKKSFNVAIAFSIAAYAIHGS